MVRPKLAKLLHKQVRVILIDGRHLAGKLLSFDGHMNLVVDNVQEFRKTKAGDTQQRSLGLVVLRGDQVISTIPEGSFNPTPEKQQPISLQL